MHLPQRLTVHEAGHRFDAETEFANRKTALAGQSTMAKAREILGQVVLWSVDDPQIFAASAFQCGLDQSFGVARDEVLVDRTHRNDQVDETGGDRRILAGNWLQMNGGAARGSLGDALRARWAGEELTPPELLRLSVGCEHVEDLWSDLDAALAAGGG